MFKVKGRKVRVIFFYLKAAEKAVKAAIFLENYSNRLTSHDLVTLSNMMSDKLLCTLCQSLQRTTGRSEAMRYPDCWQSPSIPHTRYTEHDANTAKNLAAEIVHYVEKLVQK